MQVCSAFFANFVQQAGLSKVIGAAITAGRKLKNGELMGYV
jgi:hypothetical protein